MLDDADRDVRATALSALVTVGVSDGQALARAGLGDADGFVRATAAKLLGDLRNESDTALLVERLAEDRDPVVRRRAAESLASIGGEAAVVGLVQGLSDPIEQVRLAAVRGVRELDPAFATADLARLVLEDPMYEIRVQAARGLGTTGDPEVLKILENALEDPNEFVRAAAANAIRVHTSVRQRGGAGAAGEGSAPGSRDR
jgi:HEAT repeat protein